MGEGAEDVMTPPGVIVNHINASTERYIGSPGLARMPDGTYVASHDIFGPGSPKDETLVFSSPDQGQTWSHISTISGQWWSSLFWHRDALYLMGTSREYGHAVIRRSTDGGTTWTGPGVLLDDGPYHCAPVPVVIHRGRIWRAMEDAQGEGGWGTHFRAFMMSAAVDADLLNPGSWTTSNRIARDPSLLDGEFGGWLEGNAVVDPDGNIVNVLRADYWAGPTTKAAIISVNPQGDTATFEGFIDFPGGGTKFTIRRDERDRRYWTLSNDVPDPQSTHRGLRARNTLSLFCSADLRKWERRAQILHHPEDLHHAFQYVDWLFDGDDIAVLSRTAFDDDEGGAHNYHDANFLTFHRIEKFRTRSE